MEFDPAALLNASFRQWGIEAQAHGESRSGGGIRIRIVYRDSELWCLRVAMGTPIGTRVGIPAPGSGPLGWTLAHDARGDRPLEAGIRSLTGLLLALRHHYDSDFVPGRAIVGVRPADA